MEGTRHVKGENYLSEKRQVHGSLAKVVLFFNPRVAAKKTIVGFLAVAAMFRFL